MHYADYHVEFLYCAFNDAFDAWMQTGGPDAPEPRLTENYERTWRRLVCCPHGIKPAECRECKSSPKPYLGDTTA